MAEIRGTRLLGRSVNALVLGKGVLAEEQVQQVFDLEHLIGRRKSEKK